MGEWLRRSAPVLVGVAALFAVLTWVVWGPRQQDDGDIAEVGERDSRRQRPVSDPEAVGDELEPAGAGESGLPPPVPVPEAAAEEDSEAMDDALAAAWAQVDLAEVHRAMPDNLFFELAVPTTDEAVIEARAAERRRWNEEYGKILSGTGTEEEIRAYYDQRARLSTDYIEFTSYLLDHYRDVLLERDVGLLELARKLHAARLEEIPRKVEEAFERKRQQDEAREAWLKDEAEFGRGSR
jgi:hypothetical protein